MNPGQEIQACHVQGMIRPQTDKEVNNFLHICPGGEQSRDDFSVTWRHGDLMLRVERDTGGRDSLFIGPVAKPNTFYLYEQIALARRWIKKDEILNYTAKVEEYFAQDKVEGYPPAPPDCLDVTTALKVIKQQAQTLSALLCSATSHDFVSNMEADWKKFQEQMWHPVAT